MNDQTDLSIITAGEVYKYEDLQVNFSGVRVTQPVSLTQICHRERLSNHDQVIQNVENQQELGKSLNLGESPSDQNGDFKPYMQRMLNAFKDQGNSQALSARVSLLCNQLGQQVVANKFVNELAIDLMDKEIEDTNLASSNTDHEMMSSGISLLVSTQLQKKKIHLETITRFMVEFQLMSGGDENQRRLQDLDIKLQMAIVVRKLQEDLKTSFSNMKNRMGSNLTSNTSSELDI